MSLLDKGNTEVIVYPEIAVKSPDGNTKTKPSTTGIVAKVRLDVQGQSGTSSRRQEQDNEGYESERVYSIRFTRKFHDEHGPFGPQSRIEWNGQKWALFGYENLYNRSRRTRHSTYTIKRY